MSRSSDYYMVFSPTLGFLDGFDGSDYEWGKDYKTAWQMKKDEADRRCEICTPYNAKVIPASKGYAYSKRIIQS